MSELKEKIKKLAEKMEENTLLEYEYDDYMKDKERRDIFRRSAKHNILFKKKLAYIDQETSGKLLVATANQVSKKRGIYPVGSVFSIKAYGQKNRYLGDIDKVLRETEENQKKMVKNVMERALKNKLNLHRK